MVLNEAVQMLREADELKQKILKFKNGTSMLQERSLWVTQQQLQKVYQKVLVLDLDYALEKKVEQDLWNVGFKQQIEALQSISKDRKNPLRSDGQAMLSWVLQAAAGFYLCLLHQICSTFKLDLPFRRRASLLGWVEGWGAGGAAAGARLPPPAAARYICQHCLVHLGDLARYRHQLTVAHSFYRHALVVSVHSGQPYNQLALVAWRRGRRLAALYWHVRSLLVRAPFPPAPANLARTLHVAASGGLSSEGSLPVLPGLDTPAATPPVVPSGKLDAHSYVTELIRAIHMIHTVDQLETAEGIVNRLNAALPSLIVADAFEAMTLVKLACVLMWVVESATEGLGEAAAALSDGEATAARLAAALAAAALRAALLAAAVPVPRALPALKVWLQWCACRPRLWRAPPWAAAGWAALRRLPRPAPVSVEPYSKCPLPEDEELHGFLPLEGALEGLRFQSHAAWDTYGGRLPSTEDADEQLCDASVRLTDEDTQQKVRAARIVALARRVADIRPDLISYTEDEEGNVQFTAAGEEQVAAALAELTAGAGRGPGAEPSADGDSDDEPPPPPPPVVISEADFREKVREKRVGILKPQGSLERAREERALATTQDEQDSDGAEDNNKSEEKKDSRKPRVNIAMAAIMRKQEESNKQVKFVTPPPTPESSADTAEKEEKPKIVQPKPIKSLSNLPIGRKTGGILSLKDKSAGYPHLVNTDTDSKKTEKEDKKESKPSQNPQNQNHQQKWQDSSKWSGSQSQTAAYSDTTPRTFQKNYGILNTGNTFNPNYTLPVNNQGIKLPVVNPKEIDVRTAALQKQTSRAELFEGNKFHGYHVSGDKKNFLNDLPPRFANQQRYWQSAQDSQLENKFRDDSFKQNNAFNAQWTGQRPDNHQPVSWWKPENPPNYNANFNQNIPNFYSPQMNVSNPYQNIPSFNPMQGAVGQQKPENVYPSAIGQNLSLQNMATNFTSPLNSFGTYTPSVGYDAAMYPQFGNKLGYQTLKTDFQKDLMAGFGGSAIDPHQRNANVNFNERLGGGMGPMKNVDVIGGMQVKPGDPAANTYSLFSGAPEAAWAAAAPHLPHQSLWSGPGPSPLERLLEQQKLMKPSPPQ